MSLKQDIFFEVPCLTENSSQLSGPYLQKKWFKKTDKRYIGQALQKFIDYNIQSFQFLKVTPFLSGSDNDTKIYFRSDKYIGAIPLRAPDTGKQTGDFIVTPRYGTSSGRFSSYIEIVNLLEHTISPEFIDSLPLASGLNFRPPLYFEAAKYINLLSKLVKTPWRKFNSEEKILNFPKGQIKWNKYVEKEHDPRYRIIFPARFNSLSEDHRDYSAIKHVFEICKREIASSNTPLRIKLQLEQPINFISEKLKSLEPFITIYIQIRNADTPLIKKTKEQANKILSDNLDISRAWRIDFAEVFEKYIQYIFKKAAQEIGGTLFPNYQFKGRYINANTWQLSYIEPDAILKKQNYLYFIDAKYKSHLYNKFSDSTLLKEEHRNDLHQILAYSSFDIQTEKYSFLCYPFDKVTFNQVHYSNPLSQTKIKIGLLGVPLDKSFINEVKTAITKEISSHEKDKYKVREVVRNGQGQT